jgi:hypothetical protein
VPESEEAKREKREGGDERWKERRGDLTGLDFSSASTEFGIEFGEMRFNKEGANFRKKHGLNGCNILFSLRCLKKKKIARQPHAKTHGLGSSEPKEK